MVEVYHKLTKIGHSFGFIVPKSLIACNVLSEGKFYKVVIEPISSQEKKPVEPKGLKDSSYDPFWIIITKPSSKTFIYYKNGVLVMVNQITAKLNKHRFRPLLDELHNRFHHLFSSDSEMICFLVFICGNHKDCPFNSMDENSTELVEMVEKFKQFNSHPE